MFITKQNNVSIILNTPYTNLPPTLTTSFLLKDVVVERIQGIANARKLNEQRPLQALKRCEEILKYKELKYNITHYDFLFRTGVSNLLSKFIKGLTTQQMLTKLRAKR